MSKSVNLKINNLLNKKEIIKNTKKYFNNFDCISDNRGISSSKNFVGGTVILIIFTLIGKVLGAIYRIPLASILGGIGMGQYQLVFPLYCLILTISTSGIPVAISKIVAEFNAKQMYENSKRLLKISILILSCIALFGFLFLMLFAHTISDLQGNTQAYFCYYGIAPAILFVGVISAFRGYFQGSLNMIPTAVSNLIEQVVKIIVGLFLAKKLISKGITYAVFGALLGVSISELFAFIFLFICYLISSRRNEMTIIGLSAPYSQLSKRLAKIAFPITVGGLVIPASGMIDSFLVVNLLIMSGFSTDVSTSLLGLQAGVVEPLINLPVVVSIAIATSLIPSISSLSISGQKNKIEELVKKSIEITLCISIASIICFIVFGKQIIIFLYGNSFVDSDILLSTKILFLSSINIIFISLVQVTLSILQALGKAGYTVKSLVIGCATKVLFEIIFVSIKSINIFGVIISSEICFLIILILNFREIKKNININFLQIYSNAILQEFSVCLVAVISNKFFGLMFNETISMFFAGTIAVIVFAITYYIFFITNKENIFIYKTLKKLEK